MEDDQSDARSNGTSGSGPVQVSYLYAVPSFIASFAACTLIYEILPRMGGIRDILMTLAPVLITIYAVNEIEKNAHRRR